MGVKINAVSGKEIGAINKTFERSTEEFTPSTSGSGTPSWNSVTQGRFLPGAMLAGRYRIVGLLGKGGMGEVCRADDLKLGQAVALKFLPPQFSKDSKWLEYFHNEVRLARQVSHPNVCRVSEAGAGTTVDNRAGPGPRCRGMEED